MSVDTFRLHLEKFEVGFSVNESLSLSPVLCQYACVHHIMSRMPIVHTPAPPGVEKQTSDQPQHGDIERRFGER